MLADNKTDSSNDGLKSEENEKGSWEYWELPVVITSVVLIFLVAIILRSTLLGYYGFYEPDDYYHYSVIRAAIAHNFIVPLYLSISGGPAHTIVSEPRGLYYTVLFPYFFLRYFGISAFTIMRHISIFFGLLDIIGAYLLARYLSKDRLFALLVMAFVALNMGDAARTSALIFRGDGFVTIFLLLALVCALASFKAKARKNKIMLAVLAGFTLSLANFVWNGAPFTTVVFLLFYLLVLLFGFTFEDKKLFEDAKYLLITFVVWFAFVSMYRSAVLIMGQSFTGPHFILIFVLLLAGLFMLEWLSKASKVKEMNSYERFFLFFIIFVIAFFALFVVLPGYMMSIIQNGSFLILSSNRFSETIQELQPPSFAFLFASFNQQLYLVPMDYPLIWSTSVSGAAKIFFWFLVVIFTLPYFFMQIYDSNGFANGKPKVLFDYHEPLLALVAYFVTTAYLQMSAIRFNSLISVPLSIFAAYTVYWLLMFAKRLHKFVYYFGLLVVLYLVFDIVNVSWRYTLSIAPADEICLPQFFCYNPKDPPVVQALTWLKYNSPSNSVVLTLWPDGSLVEGIANRTSVTDSVGSQNASKADPFAEWLFNASPDGKFLLSPINGKPNYLLVRYAWLAETGGIYTESGYNASAFYNKTLVNDTIRSLLSRMHVTSLSQLNSSQANEVGAEVNSYIESLFGYAAFGTTSEAPNKTAVVFTFRQLQPETKELNNSTAQFIIENVNGTKKVSALLYIDNNVVGRRILPFANVILYNMVNANYTVIPINTTEPGLYSLLISYSSTPRSTLPINITGAFMLAPGLAKSNMVKFLYLCGYTSCAWDNNIASLKLVYANLDTKIFKIEYNDSNASIASIHYN
ncbi:MAG: hypothetical protein ACP5T4_00710 [Candidatus Micrarchaeia archaeon]